MWIDVVEWWRVGRNEARLGPEEANLDSGGLLVGKDRISGQQLILKNAQHWSTPAWNVACDFEMAQLKDCQNYLGTIVGQKSCLFLEEGHLESNLPSPRNIGNVSLEGNFSNKTRFNHFKVWIRLLTLKIKQVTKFSILWKPMFIQYIWCDYFFHLMG